MGEMSCKISVVVTVHNNEAFLTECIMSVIKQTYKDIELILVDDGSMDRSGKICDVSAESSPRTRVIHKENGGVVSAWKAGVLAAGGDYICFLDGDDYLSHEMIEDMAQFLTEDPKEIICCDYITEFPDGGKKYHRMEMTAGEYDEEKIRSVILPGILGKEKRYFHTTRCAKLIAKQLLLDNMKYADEKIVRGEDLAIMLPCIADADRIVILDRKVYYHHRGDELQQGLKYDTKLESSMVRLYEAGKKIIEDKFPGVDKSFRMQQLQSEYLLEHLAFIRNEALYNPVLYRRNIQRRASSEEIRAILEDIRPEIRDPENRVAFRVLKHPGTLSCILLRLRLLSMKKRGAEE